MRAGGISAFIFATALAFGAEGMMLLGAGSMAPIMGLAFGGLFCLALPIKWYRHDKAMRAVVGEDWDQAPVTFRHDLPPGGSMTFQSVETDGGLSEAEFARGEMSLDTA